MPRTNPEPSYGDKRKLIILIRMTLRIRKLLTTLKQPPDPIIILMAVRMGDYEDKPMDSGGIAAVTGMSRVTVIRHIRYLVRSGWVRIEKHGRRKVCRMHNEPAHTDAFYRELEYHLREGVRQLSRLNTLVIALSLALI